jgi:hypothetical protein
MNDLDYLYQAISADNEALEDAIFTLQIIKKTDPGVYDQMIDESIRLINKALSMPVMDVIERIAEGEKCE